MQNVQNMQNMQNRQNMQNMQTCKIHKLWKIWKICKIGKIYKIWIICKITKHTKRQCTNQRWANYSVFKYYSNSIWIPSYLYLHLSFLEWIIFVFGPNTIRIRNRPSFLIQILFVWVVFKNRILCDFVIRGFQEPNIDEIPIWLKEIWTLIAAPGLTALMDSTNWYVEVGTGHRSVGKGCPHALVMWISLIEFDCGLYILGPMPLSGRRT